MPRKRESGKRAEIEAALVDHLLAHGVADLSFRAVATALGTSTFPLVYHFGSKEGLVAAALAGVEERQRAMIAAWAREQPALGIGEMMRRYWEWAVQPELLPYHRLYFEVYGLALQRPEQFGGFLKRGGITAWAAFMHEQLGAIGSDELRDLIASLILATVGGAVLTLLSDGDVERGRRTIAAVAADLERRLATPGD